MPGARANALLVRGMLIALLLIVEEVMMGDAGMQETVDLWGTCGARTLNVHIYMMKRSLGG